MKILATRIAAVSCLIYFGLSYPSGNDFVGYFSNYQCIVNDLCGQNVGSFEPGFNAITFVFGQIGYQAIVFFIAVFNVFCLLRFSRNFKSGLIVFVIMAGGLAWQLYTEALRQAIAISIVLLAIPCLLERKGKQFALLVFVASWFHASALLCLVLLSTFFGKSTAKIITFALAVFSVIFFFAPSAVIEVILIVVPDDFMVFDKLYFYVSTDIYKPETVIGFGVIPDFVLFLVLSYLMIRARAQPNIIWVSQGAIIYIVFVMVIGRAMPVLTRLGWYGLPFVAILLSTVFGGGRFLDGVKLNNLVFLRFLFYFWLISQLIRPFVYDHSAYNIMKQDAIIYRLGDLDDNSLQGEANDKCQVLHMLGYSELCTLY